MSLTTNDNKTKHKNTLRESFYIVFDYMLNQNSTNYIGFLVIHIIECFQIELFALWPVFEKYWSNKSFYNIVSTFLEYFQINEAFVSSLSNFVVILYALLFILVIMSLDFVYILVCLKKNYDIPSLCSTMLRFLCKIFIPILYLPLLSN